MMTGRPRKVNSSSIGITDGNHPPQRKINDKKYAEYSDPSLSAPFALGYRNVNSLVLPSYDCVQTRKEIMEALPYRIFGTQ